MPAEKQGATTEPKVRVASSEEFIEFANRSLEDIFLTYVDQIIKKRNATPQRLAPTSSSTQGNPPSATSATTTAPTTPRNPDVHANGDTLGEHLADHHNPRQIFTPSHPLNSTMAPENSNANSQQPAARTENAGGQPFYEQQRKKLQALLKKRAELEQKLVSCRDFTPFSSWPSPNCSLASQQRERKTPHRKIVL